MQKSRPHLGVILLGVCLSGQLLAQNTGRTVRHHKEVEPNPAFPPELTQAEGLIEKKDYAAAEPLLKKVVTADPANYQAWFDLGFVYNGLGNTTESIAAYRKAVAAKPDVFESNLNLGLMLVKAGDPEAEKFLRAATTLKPTAHEAEGRERAWLSLGHVLEATRPQEAIEAFKQAAALVPNDPEPLLSLAPLLENENHFADAEQEYKRVLDLDPNSIDALIGLAGIYARGNRFHDSQEVLRRLVELHPDDAAAHKQLGRVLAASGENDKAVSELRSAMKLAPSDLTLQRDLSDLYRSTGKFDLAEAGYRSLLVGSPNDAELHQALGSTLLNQKRFPEAEQEFRAAVRLKPDFGAAYGDLAVAANENKNYALAIQAADARAKFLPEIPVGYFLRATAYDHLRAYKQAAENYHKFLAVANGQYPDQEWQARHRLITIEPKK